MIYVLSGNIEQTTRWAKTTTLPPEKWRHIVNSGSLPSEGTFKVVLVGNWHRRSWDDINAILVVCQEAEAEVVHADSVPAKWLESDVTLNITLPGSVLVELSSEEQSKLNHRMGELLHMEVVVVKAPGEVGKVWLMKQ